MLGIFGTIFSARDEREAARSYFQNNSIPMPDELLNNVERMHRMHEKSCQQALQQHLARGLPLKEFSYIGSSVIE